MWQIDSGSINSILNINSSLEFLKRVYGRVSMIPLVLALVEQTVINPDDQKKKTVRVLQLTAKFTMMQLAAAAGRIAGQFLIPAPSTTEAPDDQNDESEREPDSLEAEGDNNTSGEISAPQNRRTGTQPGAPTHTPTPGEQEAERVWTEEIANKPNPAEQKEGAGSAKPAHIPGDPIGNAARAEMQKKAEKPEAAGPKVTAAQLKRMKEFKDNYSVKLAPYIRKQNKDVTAINELTEEQAEAVLREIEEFLLKKGVL